MYFKHFEKHLKAYIGLCSLNTLDGYDECDFLKGYIALINTIIQGDMTGCSSLYMLMILKSKIINPLSNVVQKKQHLTFSLKMFSPLFSGNNSMSPLIFFFKKASYIDFIDIFIFYNAK